MDYSSKTNISFTDGEVPSAEDLNSLVDSINSLSDKVNEIINKINEISSSINSIKSGIEKLNKTVYDFPAEDGEVKEYSLLTAVSTIPSSRRVLGLKVRFFNKSNKSFTEYSFLGDSLEDWENVDKWEVCSIELIDGGTF